MITKEMKISMMLEAYPETLEVLIKASPHFNKLKNKVLRKALASRVNVEHAASVAGIKLSDLLKELNKAVNPDSQIQIIPENSESDDHQADEPDNSFLQSIENKKIIELDVRPIIQSGKDPFLDIMNKVKMLKDDEVLLLINSFEPIPLYAVMEKKKYQHVTFKKPSEYYVYFIKKDNESSENSNQLINNNNVIHPSQVSENIIEIDVRELEPPEPMLKILETLPQLDDNSVLVVHHHRDPLMLYEKLEERGYQAEALKIQENYFKVIVTKKKE